MTKKQARQQVKEWMNKLDKNYIFLIGGKKGVTLI